MNIILKFIAFIFFLELGFSTIGTAPKPPAQDTPLSGSKLHSEEVKKIEDKFQSQEEIEEIRSKIDTSIGKYERKSYHDINVYKDINPHNYSFESTKIYELVMINLEKIYDKEEIKKIIVKFEGERDDQTSQYYFQNGKLIFVLKTRFSYEKSKLDEKFDSEEKKVIENKYYFNEGKMLKPPDPQEQNVGLNNNEIEREIINDVKVYENYEK
ncbi:hypothetical protein HZA38_06430 [Candidatus Peregrinibacteria bacterium]|nr:hypothetical protein [Candidatus Peregrinibacteria bacterium]